MIVIDIFSIAVLELKEKMWAIKEQVYKLCYIQKVSWEMSIGPDLEREYIFILSA